MSKAIGTTTYHNNKIFTIFYFDKNGDILEKHTHDFDTVHTSEVLKGSFKLKTDKYEKEIYEGDLIDFEVGEYHEFISLKDK
jgi:quercetin dioxygenase-like cupin family protein